MGWWGKVIGSGFGFMMGGPIGAILGASLGHQFDKGITSLDGNSPDSIETTQTAFFTCLFSVMGHIAKADGRVTASEISMTQSLFAQMNLDQNQRKIAVKLFNQGKQDSFQCSEVLKQFRAVCHRKTTLLQMFLEILISTAYADGNLHPAELKILREASFVLGFSDAQFEQLLSMSQANRHSAGQSQPSGRLNIEDAYVVLACSPSTPLPQIKTAYRRLISQHHPDKLVSKGLPEEMIKIATQKTSEIRSAYETILEARKK